MAFFIILLLQRRKLRLSTSPQITQLVSRAADPRVQALTLLCPIRGVRLPISTWECRALSGGRCLAPPLTAAHHLGHSKAPPPLPCTTHSLVGKHPASPQAGDTRFA